MFRKFPRVAVAGLCAAGLAGTGCAVAFAQSGPQPQTADTIETTSGTTASTTTTSATTTVATTSTGTTSTGTTTTGTTTTGTATSTTGTATSTTGTATSTTGTATSSTTTVTPLNPVIQPATQIGPASAVLNGTVDTEGEGGSYSFEYDTLSDYEGAQNDLSGTTAVYIQPGATSLTNVSAGIGCYPASVCTYFGETPLVPNTTYEYILEFNTGTGGKVASQYNSTEGTFTTNKYGLIKPGVKTFRFSGHRLALPLSCDSSVACSGKARIDAKVKHKTATCGSKTFSIDAGGSKTLQVALSSKCVAAAKHAAGGRLTGSLGIALTTGQPAVSEKVHLIDTKG